MFGELGEFGTISWGNDNGVNGESSDFARFGGNGVDDIESGEQIKMLLKTFMMKYEREVIEAKDWVVRRSGGD